MSEYTVTSHARTVARSSGRREPVVRISLGSRRGPDGRQRADTFKACRNRNAKAKTKTDMLYIAKIRARSPAAGSQQ